METNDCSTLGWIVYDQLCVWQQQPTGRGSRDAGKAARDKSIWWRETQSLISLDLVTYEEVVRLSSFLRKTLVLLGTFRGRGKGRGLHWAEEGRGEGGGKRMVGRHWRCFNCNFFNKLMVEICAWYKNQLRLTKLKIVIIKMNIN